MNLITEPAASPRLTPVLSLRAVSGLTTAEIAIFRALHSAIVEQRLLPGTRLTEEELAEIFQTSRMRIRRVLLTLAHEGVVALSPGRGAVVACPTAEEARAIFQARNLIETGLIGGQSGAIAPSLITKLQACWHAEIDAHRAQDRTGMIAQSGLFHIGLAEGLGNPVLADIVSNLVSRSSLIIALFQHSGSICCRVDDHQHLIKALADARISDAVALMHAHLTAIEAGLDLSEKPAFESDLRAILKAD